MLPYLSIVQEKAEALTSIMGSLGWTVQGYTGREASTTPLAAG